MPTHYEQPSRRSWLLGTRTLSGSNRIHRTDRNSTSFSFWWPPLQRPNVWHLCIYTWRTLARLATFSENVIPFHLLLDPLKPFYHTIRPHSKLLATVIAKIFQIPTTSFWGQHTQNRLRTFLGLKLVFIRSAKQNSEAKCSNFTFH